MRGWGASHFAVSPMGLGQTFWNFPQMVLILATSPSLVPRAPLITVSPCLCVCVLMCRHACGGQRLGSSVTLHIVEAGSHQCA